MRKARPFALLGLMAGPMTVAQLHRLLERKLGRRSPFLSDEATLAKTLQADERYGHVIEAGGVFTLSPKGRAYVANHPLVAFIQDQLAEGNDRHHAAEARPC